MKLESPKDLFIYELCTIYDAEKKIVEILNEVSGQVNDKTLAELLRTHQKETQQQIKNLDQCFQVLGESPQSVSSGVIDAVRKEHKEFVSQKPSADVLTMFILGGSLKIEHFEIASYRGLVGKAMLMGETQLIQLLETNLLEEEETAGKLERCAHELSQRMLAVA